MLNTFVLKNIFMQHENKFNLINGIFKSEDAKAVLLELYSHKIRFHEREMFSNLERFGEDLLNSERRIVELKFEQKELEKLLAYAEKQSLQMKIECSIKTNLINNKNEKY